MQEFLNKSFKEDVRTFIKKLPDNSVDLVFTDPPYKTISGGRDAHRDYGWMQSILKKNDGKIFKYNDIKFFEYIPEIYRVLKENADFYIMINDLNLHKLMTECNKYFKYHGLLIWAKPNVVSNRWYMKNCEFILYYYKGNAKTINNPGSKKIEYFNFCKYEKKIHETQKPVSLCEFYINNSTHKGDIVFDPFMGSHSSAIACIKNGRNFIGCEKDLNYWEKGNSWIKEYKISRHQGSFL